MQIPGKTFLVGEYSVLVGGKALVLATAPGFDFQKSDQPVKYHPLSAAGLYAEQNNIVSFATLHNRFNVGGFGQSTAEYISVWLEKNKIIKTESVSRIFEDYMNCYQFNKKTRPSGADLISQIYGEVTYFAHPLDNCKRISWPFRQVGFFILSTGKKIQTHQHLENLNRNDLLDLIPYSDKVIQYFLENKQYLFFDSIKEWSSLLKRKGLQDASTLDLKKQIESNYPEIYAVKLNGALGVDTITLFYDLNQKEKMRDIVKVLNQKFGCAVQADETMLLKGVLNNGMD